MLLRPLVLRSEEKLTADMYESQPAYTAAIGYAMCARAHEKREPHNETTHMEIREEPTKQSTANACPGDMGKYPH